MLVRIYDVLRLCFWLCWCWGAGLMIIRLGMLAMNEKDINSSLYLPQPLGLGMMLAGVGFLALPILHYSIIKEKNPSQKMTISFLLDGRTNPRGEVR